VAVHYQGADEEQLALSALTKLFRAADSVSARVHAHLAGVRLSPSQFGVLEALLHLGPLHQCELGEKLLKSSGNITVVIDNLEHSGLVERRRDSADRRLITIHLTPAGRRRIKGLFPRHARHVQLAFSTLSAAEQKQLARLCKKLGLANGPHADTRNAEAQ